ncbi:alkaline shock protein [Acetivibrio straminisolvens JCM 21531]|uniref:Alkaline shock protein n=1 Tax=Acetivibrio straminisolvens JCM 21531 TaxID=1294263 RepID=W4V3E2_9FIRM|nr:alkaline shock protein [Acetivibrio straminisolvens JCM 21531]
MGDVSQGSPGDRGTLKISEEVVAIIAGIAAMEVPGVAA